MSLQKLPPRESLVATALVLFLTMTMLYLVIQPANAEQTHNVIIQDFAFNPEILTIQLGDTVTWTNNDSVIYTLWFVTTQNQTYLLSDPILPDESWSYTFNEIVDLKYYCFERLWIVGFIHISVTYDLTITTALGGTTSPAPGTYTHTNGTVVSVTAIPYTNYVFDHWELDSSWNYSNPKSVTMDSDHTLHAVFRYSPTVGGIVNPVDKFGLLAPYIALAIAVVAITIGTVYARKRWLRKSIVQRP